MDPAGIRSPREIADMNGCRESMTMIDRRPWLKLRRRRDLQPPEPPTIELQGVTFVDEDGRQVLDEAAMLIPPGAMVCIVGTGDRDQATLAALLLGLERPRQGTVELDGDDIGELPLQELRRRVAGVLQDPWLIDGTIADNISFDLPGVSRADVEAAAKRIGIDPMIRAGAGGYDGSVAGLTLGQRRAIGLARAVARDPGVLVLEEPTTDLEPDEEREMIRAVAAGAEGRTTIVLTHRLSLARRADTVLVVERGQLVPYRGKGTGPGGGHARLWDTRVPPVLTRPGGTHLRLVVGGGERTAIQPTRGPWSITIGDELIPGHLASGLLSRTPYTETWLTWSVELEQPVRVRVPRIASSAPPTDDPVSYLAWDQLAREHRVLRRLVHPGAIQLVDADLDADMPYLALEYLDSISLSRVLQRTPDGLAPLDALQIGFELAGTLHQLHQLGHVHLNVRTVHVRTRGDIVVLTDFSRCRPIGTPLPQPAPLPHGRRVDRRVLAPELRPGQPADPSMDVYALGTLIHRATAGSVVASTTAGRDRPVPYRELNPEAPAAMAAIVDRMLSPDPDDRPDTRTVLAEFRRILPRTLVRPRVSMVRTRSTRLRLVSPDN